MTYTTNHVYADEKRRAIVSTNGDTATISFSTSGSFSVRNPGKLNVTATAGYSVHIRVSERGRWQVSSRILPLTVEIKTPDDQPFTADHVMMNDIWRFRDLRGTSQGSWTYRVHGQASVPVDPEETRVTADDGRVTISLEETVFSHGAPLVSDVLAANVGYQYPIDLFHVGMFTATAQTRQLPFLHRGRPIKLVDPDGNVLAASNEGSISYPVTLQTIDRSRDANGGYRVWLLNVAAAPDLHGPTPIRAQVTASARVSTQVLQSRINTMLGPNGRFVSIYGEIEGTDLVARLVIHDKVSAETIDMHGLLNSVIEWPDPNDPKDVAPEVVYTIARHTRDLDYEMHVSLDDLKITAIDISIGQSEQIQPAVPALKVRVGVSGGATIKLGGFPIATAKIRDNSISLEAGIRLNAGGSFTPVHWVQDDRLDVDVSWEAAVAAGVVSLGLLSLGAAGVAEYIEHEFNEAIARRFGAVLDGALGRAPRILEVLMGGELNYTGLRLEGDDLVFDYHAPPEQNLRPKSKLCWYPGPLGDPARPECLGDQAPDDGRYLGHWQPEQDRPHRRGDDGEPLLRPCPGLPRPSGQCAECRRADRRTARLPGVAGLPGPQAQGLRHPAQPLQSEDEVSKIGRPPSRRRYRATMQTGDIAVRERDQQPQGVRVELQKAAYQPVADAARRCAGLL